MSLSRRIKVCLTAAITAPALVIAPNAVAAELPGSGNSTGSLGSLSSLGSLGSSGSGTTPDDTEAPGETETPETVYPGWVDELLGLLETSDFPPEYFAFSIRFFDQMSPEDQALFLEALRTTGVID